MAGSGLELTKEVQVATDQWENLVSRLEGVLDHVDSLLERVAPELAQQQVDFALFWAYRWQKTGDGGKIVPVEHPHLVDLDDLVGVDYAKELLVRNTAQFVAGAPANNVLLWGERGNGKSSCVKGLLNLFAPRGLRIIEVQRWDLLSLPAIVGFLRDCPFRFILFCDDLSFGEEEAEFRALKTLLDGGIEARPENVLIYATSNRRHLMPELMSDNTGSAEIHPEEAVSEKLSLSDRFGLALGFSTFDQETYLAIVENYAQRLVLTIGWEELKKEALLWALYSGRRSGRSARQFIDDLKGRIELG
ncbi:MAG TPA: ATP-binding protein [Geobacteraceae bacterium]|nr:ATP-binding protein [Geobacteraceae bacterium]